MSKGFWKKIKTDVTKAQEEYNKKYNEENPPDNNEYAYKEKRTEEIEEDGTRKIKVEYEEINLTKKLNETAKIIKAENAKKLGKNEAIEEILAELTK